MHRMGMGPKGKNDTAQGGVEGQDAFSGRKWKYGKEQSQTKETAKPHIPLQIERMGGRSTQNQTAGRDNSLVFNSDNFRAVPLGTDPVNR